jgi:predicted glutamine amidotransferase
MCRLLGALFVKIGGLQYHLLEAECSLFKQAVKGRQSDGWGIGYYSDENPVVRKSEKAVYDDRSSFEEAAKSVRGRIIMAHVRKASNPRRLPFEKLISLENSQPFHYLNYMIVHNGSITIPDEVTERIGSYANLIRSNNDSEVYFYLLLYLVEKEGGIIAAFRKVERTLMEVFQEEEATKFEKPFTSLNAIFSDGEKMYAFSRYLTDSGKSICYGDSSMFQMCFKLNEEHVVVASEKTDRGAWLPLGNNSLLTCWVEEDRIKHELLDFNESM